MILFTKTPEQLIIHTTGTITLEDFINACEDNDISLDSHTTGHLMLLDDNQGIAFFCNDYGIDVIEQLNDCSAFTAKRSILDYSTDFIR